MYLSGSVLTIPCHVTKFFWQYAIANLSMHLSLSWVSVLTWDWSGENRNIFQLPPPLPSFPQVGWVLTFNPSFINLCGSNYLIIFVKIRCMQSLVLWAPVDPTCLHRLEAAVLDLVADDNVGMKKQKSVFHWDKVLWTVILFFHCHFVLTIFLLISWN